MRKLVSLILLMMLFCIITQTGISKADPAPADGGLKSLDGTYQFKKQVYMNPLSSFMAMEGFQEYYTFSEDAFLITDQAGNQRSMKVTYQPEPFDEAAFQNSFMMEGFEIPDITSFNDRRQYTITETLGSMVYRLYLLDNEIWLAQIHKDYANRLKNEYIWSIFQIERFEGAVPLAVSIYGTQDGVNDFLALQGNFQSGYDKDACYNITPYNLGQNPGFQIFKYDLSCASFLLYDNKVYPLGVWFGGIGVTSMALGDLNDDGGQELYFTYSFGSGLHRSHIAYFDPKLKRVVPIDYTHLNKDMIVAMNETGGLSLYGADFVNMESFVQYELKSTGFITDIVFEGGQIGLDPIPKE
jgi:hypothetical protein